MSGKLPLYPYPSQVIAAQQQQQQLQAAAAAAAAASTTSSSSGSNYGAALSHFPSPSNLPSSSSSSSAYPPHPHTHNHHHPQRQSSSYPSSSYSSSSSSSSSDRTLECAVCGKQFTRGHLDLTRHMNAITLQHQFTKLTNDSNYPFSCSYCHIYFHSMEHLQSHQIYTTCGKTKGLKMIKSFAEDLLLPQPLLSSTTTPATTAHTTTTNSSPPDQHPSDPLLEFTDSPEMLMMNIMDHPDLSPHDFDLLHHPDDNDTDHHHPHHEGVIGQVDGEDEREFHKLLNGSPSLSVLDPILDPLHLMNHPPLSSGSGGGESGDGNGGSNNGDGMDLLLDPSFVPLHKRNDVKTMECMICGKLFPRGPIDLHRHATGILFFLLILLISSLNNFFSS